LKWIAVGINLKLSIVKPTEDPMLMGVKHRIRGPPVALAENPIMHV
jgi:hypothetical protein